MNTFRALIPLVLAWTLTTPALALDAACVPVLKASENRINQPVWHSVTDMPGMHMEAIKFGGQFYSQRGGNWTKFAINVDDAERELIRQMRSDEVKLTQCRAIGSEVIDGVAVTVYASRLEMKGVPAADSKLYVGKIDGLPYRQTGDKLTVVYRYKGVQAPKL